MRKLWTLCACLCRWSVGQELFVDGSFLTEKIDPGDTDLILVIPASFEDMASPEQLAIWDWLVDEHVEHEDSFECDLIVVARAPSDDPDHDFLKKEEDRWCRFFSTARDGRAKGLVRISLPEGCV